MTPTHRMPYALFKRGKKILKFTSFYHIFLVGGFHPSEKYY